MRDAPATLGYIEQAARRYRTPVAAAFRRALGIADKPRRRRRRRRHGGPRKPTHQELEACRKQRHGVRWRDE